MMEYIINIIKVKMDSYHAEVKDNTDKLNDNIMNYINENIISVMVSRNSFDFLQSNFMNLGNFTYFNHFGL